MNELEKNYLAHHGILGQKWHKRNGPPYPLDAGDHSKSEQNAGYKKSLGGGRNEELYDRKARKRGAKEAAKDLNRNDQEMAENRYKFNKAKKKFDKYEKKMLKSKEGSKKREKYASKSLDAWLDSEEAREAIDKGQDRAREILGYLEENGYNVKMKDTMRSVNRGENAVKSILVSGVVTGAATALLGPAGMTGAAVGITTDRVKGTKFKVKDKTPKERQKEIDDKAVDLNQYLNDDAGLAGGDKEAQRILTGMSDKQLKKEIKSQKEIVDYWNKKADKSNKFDVETTDTVKKALSTYEDELKRREEKKAYDKMSPEFQRQYDIKKSHENYAKQHPGEKHQDSARMFFNFMEGYKPNKSASKTLYDIDDPDIIVDKMKNASFRKQYGVSDADYERFKKIYS